MYYQERHQTWARQLHRMQQGRTDEPCAMSGGGAVPEQLARAAMSGGQFNHWLLDAGVADGYSSHDADLYPIQGGELEAEWPIRLLW